MKIRRYAGWDRNQKQPAVTRPKQTEINETKEAARRTIFRKDRRDKSAAAKNEALKREKFYQGKVWLGAEEVV